MPTVYIKHGSNKPGVMELSTDSPLDVVINRGQPVKLLGDIDTYELTIDLDYDQAARRALQSYVARWMGLVLAGVSFLVGFTVISAILGVN